LFYQDSNTVRVGRAQSANCSCAVSKATYLLGVRIHNVNIEETLGQMEQMIRCGKRHHVVTVNTEFVMTAQSDWIFRDVLNNASLALPDGMGIVWGSWLHGDRIGQRVTGVDSVARFASLAASKGFRPFLLGAAPGVAETAGKRLQENFPGFLVAGTHSGSPDPGQEIEICERIRQSKADSLFVAFGSPASEIWIARNLPNLPVAIAMGVGGTFDFIAGVVPRAPQWMQLAGLEWLFRLIIQPFRWKRMLALPRFVMAVLLNRLQGSRGGNPTIRGHS